MKLEELHYKCIEQLLSGTPISNIAFNLSISTADITNWYGDATFVGEMERLREQLQVQCKDVVSSNLRDHAPHALAQIITLSSSAKSERMRLSASQDILDRAGFGAIQKHHEVIEMRFPPGTLELAQKVLEEMEGRTINVNPTNEPAGAGLLSGNS